MIILMKIGLACGVCLAGFQAFRKLQGRQKGRWFLTQRGHPKRWLTPWSTRSFIVRCWTEHTSEGQPGTMRYSLEDATTGERLGYLTTNELLQALAKELYTTTKDWMPFEAMSSARAA
jgi:hypothetical protein